MTRAHGSTNAAGSTGSSVTRSELMAAQLLRQPGGFEGLGAVRERIELDHESVPNGRHVEEVHGNVHSLVSGASAQNQVYEEDVAGGNHLQRLEAKLRQRLLEGLVPRTSHRLLPVV